MLAWLLGILLVRNTLSSRSPFPRYFGGHSNEFEQYESSAKDNPILYSDRFRDVCDATSSNAGR